MRVMVTGATGMVGEGVLLECLNDADVGQVLVVGRKTCGVEHPKLEEAIVADFFDLSGIEHRLKGIDACFFCLGVSSVGMKEADYKRVTYDLTMSVAGRLAELNPGMVFCYVTGASTDSTERGRSMWARVKGKTENDLMRLPFKGAYMFRPGYLHPTPGARNAHKYYRWMTWLFPLMRKAIPNHVSTLAELGQAMLRAAKEGGGAKIVEVRDLVKMARQF